MRLGHILTLLLLNFLEGINGMCKSFGSFPDQFRTDKETIILMRREHSSKLNLKSKVRKLLPFGFESTYRKFRGRMRINRHDEILFAPSQKDFVFIHIPKCGGTSVEEALGISMKLHDTAQERMKKIGKREWINRFKFAVVRNPYDRVVSDFFYRERTAQNNLRADGIELNQWIKLVFLERDEAYYDVPMNFAPCYEWISDKEGKLIIDYVLFLERIDDDWAYVVDQLRANYILKKLNSTIWDPKRSELSAESIDIINSFFEVDFEKFGYKRRSP